MSLIIRDVRAHELEQVLLLNNNAGASILPIDATKMKRFFDCAQYFRIAEIDGNLAGFLIALDAKTPYESPNFRWFHARFAEFVYIDRIVIASNYRRHGLGRIFYADVQSFAEVRSPRLACEIFLEPRDDASVVFHSTYGFKEVGQQTIPGGHRVSLLMKDMCSFEFVHKTYWQASSAGLPALPWLAGRPCCEPIALAINQA